MQNSLVPTLNKMGYMFNDLTEYDEKFISFCEKRKGPVLEIGAAFGVITMRLASKEIFVVANDLEGRHLEEIKKKSSSQQRKYITTKPGKFPQELDFSEGTFSAIHLSNIIHYLKGEELELGIPKLLKWLHPQGKVFLIAGTPYAYQWQEFIPIYEEKLDNKEKWPGYIDDLSIFKHNSRFTEIPDFMHFFSPDLLKSIFIEYGFDVEEFGYCERPSWPSDMRWDGRESAGIIASKPR